MRCINCKSKFEPRFFLQKHCSECKEAERKYQESKVSAKTPKPVKKIAPVSEKRKVENLQYSVLRIEFLGKPENRKCPITGQATTDVHHMMGRIGYADQSARDNKITLYLDTRFWLALSRDGHRQVEENPEWAKAHGYSLDRLTL